VENFLLFFSDEQSPYREISHNRLGCSSATQRKIWFDNCASPATLGYQCMSTGLVTYDKGA